MIVISETGWRLCFGGFAFVLSFGLISCGNPGSVLPETVEDEDLQPVIETRWTERTELFVEYPQLVENRTSWFAIHFTDLSTFEPVQAGRAVVYLTDGETEEFAAAAPVRPGIFEVAVRPNTPGSYRLELELDAPGLTDRHDLGTVTVQTVAEATVPAVLEDPATRSISFLKEQQWVFDFATGLAERSQMSESIVLAAEIEVRTGGRVDVTTPVAGRLANDISVRPVGVRVERGENLAEIIPHSGHGDDRPALQLDVAEARDALELAQAERTRVERVVEVGALPRRRQLEARVTEQTARARVSAAEAHLAQLDATRAGAGEDVGDMRFVLRAPMSGVVAQADATPGASVAQGTRLFRLVALDRVHIVGALPEAELSRVDELVAAELEIPGGGAPVALDQLVSIGRVLDRDSRTVPIVYELSAPDRRFAIGQAVSLRLFLSATTEAIAVPESAIVDDAGQPVVFVQVAGESFDRRAVQLGNRESGFVQISGNVALGERIVVQGAPLIRLAALSTQVPAHGHTH